MARVLAVLLLFLPAVARPYPQYIAKGYTNCATCHYSPTGGGLANSYGHVAVEATFPDKVKVGWLSRLRSTLAKPDVTGLDDQDRPAFQVDAGLDVRYMALQTPIRVAGPPEWLGFPMLAEVSAVAARGPWLAYASVTPRSTGGEPHTYAAFSREHWLQYRLDPAQGLRVGRMALPFGLKIPDHTAFTREDLGFNKYDQWYALEWDLSSVRYTASVAAYDGDLVGHPTAPGERGLCASFGYNFPGRAALGASGLAGWSDTSRRVAGSLFFRVRPFGKSYLMGEAAMQQTSARDVARSQVELAGLLRAGLFLLDSADIYLETAGRSLSGAWAVTKARYAIGADWKILPWVELSPRYQLEETVETGLGGELAVQLHVFW